MSKWERVYHNLREISASKKGYISSSDLAEKLFQNDRCNACIRNDYIYKDNCSTLNIECFPDFIEQEEMAI